MSPESHLFPSRSKVGFRSEVTYDLNLMILGHCAGGDLLRVECMKKYGVVNPGGLKIHISLVVSPGDFEYVEDLSRDWAATGDVSVLEMPSRFPIPKINGYYLWLRDQGPAARWHGRVDDDSITDVAEALRYLDAKFGGREVHVATGPVIPHEHEPLLVPYLLEKGIHLPDVRTEWESSFTSASAMARIFSNEQATAMIMETSRLFRTPGDRTLALAAHLSGVPFEENFASRWGFEFERLTLLGGDLHHIHYVPWANKELTEMMAAFFAVAEQGLSRELLQAMIGIPLCFDSVQRVSALITLTPEGRVIGGRDVGVDSWNLQEGELRLFSAAGETMVSFAQSARGNSGLVLQARDEKGWMTHVLRQPVVGKPGGAPGRLHHRLKETHPESAFPRYGHYFRLGHDSRLMSFSVDGEIVEGHDVCERRWRMAVAEDSSMPVIDIEGDDGITGSLELDEDGIWRGRWSVAEKMPIAVLPL
jgi:hypothetical protein